MVCARSKVGKQQPESAQGGVYISSASALGAPSGGFAHIPTTYTGARARGKGSLIEGAGALAEVCAVGWLRRSVLRTPHTALAAARQLSSRAMAEEGTPPPEAELRAELAAMKVKALKKRAKEAGVDEEKLEDADDEEDVKGTIIDLIVAEEQGGPPAAAVVRPHFSTADSGGSKAAHFKSLFGDKHCMFSYNWAVQEDVKAARSEVGAAGVPTWMDIDGKSHRPDVISPRPTRRFCGAQAG